MGLINVGEVLIGVGEMARRQNDRNSRRRLRLSHAPWRECTSSLSYGNLLGIAPGFSLSLPGLSPNYARNNGLWIGRKRLSRRSQFFSFNLESIASSVFHPLENRKSCLVLLYNHYCCNRTPRNAPCFPRKLLELSSVVSGVTSLPNIADGLRKIREKTLFCFFQFRPDENAKYS